MAGPTLEPSQSDTERATTIEIDTVQELFNRGLQVNIGHEPFDGDCELIRTRDRARGCGPLR